MSRVALFSETELLSQDLCFSVYILKYKYVCMYLYMCVHTPCPYFAFPALEMAVTAHLCAEMLLH